MALCQKQIECLCCKSDCEAFSPWLFCQKQIECLCCKSECEAFSPWPCVKSKLSVCAGSQIARLLTHGLVS